ncbi:MAG: TetR family transcriptional regulator [Rhizobiaceae bacterium]|nr:TetR family transcriptional regulator [Rhizobiaceae bacterium]MCV0407663.1 TetR family transcriptional regulator [Rhizobiaceae bacterium]
MARPRTDVDATRSRLIETAERLLKRRGPERLTVTEVAKACRMSQSNAYRFVANRQELLQAMGERWFAAIEFGVLQAARSTGDPSERFVQYFREQYRLKRQLHDADPDLFAAYLRLGLANMEVVERHLERLREGLSDILSELEAAHRLRRLDAREATLLAEALMTRFRDPGQIMRHAATDSAGFAEAAARCVLGGLLNPAATTSAQDDHLQDEIDSSAAVMPRNEKV